MNIKILVCCHKKGIFTSAGAYSFIHCGKAVSDAELNILRDNAGDNISVKNSNYCELTAFYWAWKNLKDTDIIGLVHYRRFFDFSFRLFRRDIFYRSKDISINEQEAYGEKITSLLGKYDIILPMHKVFSTNLKKDYCAKHIPEDYEILRSVIVRICPEYTASFDHVMTKTNKASCYNMFITSWPIFDSYCKWLFDILFEVEKEVRISEYPYQARVFGFMAERLLNVYCYEHSLRVSYKPVLFVTLDKCVPYYLYVLNNLRCRLSFWISMKK